MRGIEEFIYSKWWKIKHISFDRYRAIFTKEGKISMFDFLEDAPIEWIKSMTYECIWKIGWDALNTMLFDKIFEWAKQRYVRLELWKKIADRIFNNNQ